MDNKMLKQYAKSSGRRAPGETEIEFQGKGKDMSIKSKTTDAGKIIYNKNFGKPVSVYEILKQVPSVVGDFIKKSHIFEADYPFYGKGGGKTKTKNV